MSDLESDFAKEADDTAALEEPVGTHHLKSHPRYFQAAAVGRKPFEVRVDDRHFVEGDVVVLHEWDPARGKKRQADGYTGRELRGRVTYIMHSGDAAVPGVLHEKYVVLGIHWVGVRP